MIPRTEVKLSVSDLAPFYEPPSGVMSRGGPERRSIIKGYSFGRRGLLRTVVAAGTVAGISALGVFPGAKEASAQCVDSLHNHIAGGCPVNVGNCSPACGPSRVHQAACNSSSFHRWTGNYRNRPNDCNSVADADGWRWRGPLGGCACPSGCLRSYRCHDGCTRLSGTWTTTICRQASSGCLCS